MHQNMLSYAHDIDKVFDFDPQKDFLGTQNELHMRDKGKINDYILSILEILREFELKDQF